MAAVPLLAVPTHESSPAQDEAICAAARNALRYSGYRVHENLCCEVRDGVVTLSGAVTSFYLKQMAQAALSKLPMIQAVSNLVTVTQGPLPGAG